MEETPQASPPASTGLVWHPVIPRCELPQDGGGITAEVDGHHVAVFDIDGELFAIDDSCPHQGASLGLGVVLEGDVTCPWHGWHFELASGANTDGLASCVAVHAVREVEGGMVEVAVRPA